MAALEYLLSENSEFVITENDINLIVNRLYVPYSPFTMSFQAESTIYQNEVRCLVNENDFNYTLNPSAIQLGTSGSYINAITGSDFDPYSTTVGLYNDVNELLVVGKLSRPYRMPPNTDMTFIVRWDS